MQLKNLKTEFNFNFTELDEIDEYLKKAILMTTLYLKFQILKNTNISGTEIKTCNVNFRYFKKLFTVQ